MPDYSEIEDARAAQPTPNGQPNPQQIAAFLRESARGAAVLTDLLDSPAWNVFRSNVGGRLEQFKAEREILRNRIEAGEIVGDERARADLRLQRLLGLIEAHEFDMALPKELIAAHGRLETMANNSLPRPAGDGVAIETA